MVARTSQAGDDNAEERRAAVTQLQSQKVVKETQREGNGLGTPRQPKKETQAPSKAQDVAELKDYV